MLIERCDRCELELALDGGESHALDDGVQMLEVSKRSMRPFRRP